RIGRAHKNGHDRLIERAIDDVGGAPGQIGGDAVGYRLLFHVGEDLVHRPVAAVRLVARVVTHGVTVAVRELAVGIVILVQPQGELPEIVLALHAAGGFTDFLDRGQQEGDQEADNGNDDQ